jgi:hypothetical protein
VSSVESRVFERRTSVQPHFINSRAFLLSIMLLTQSLAVVEQCASSIGGQWHLSRRLSLRIQASTQCTHNVLCPIHGKRALRGRPESPYSEGQAPTCSLWARMKKFSTA